MFSHSAGRTSATSVERGNILNVGQGNVTNLRQGLSDGVVFEKRNQRWTGFIGVSYEPCQEQNGQSDELDWKSDLSHFPEIASEDRSGCFSNVTSLLAESSTHLTPDQQQKVLAEGESVLNAAMACYVFDYFARMLEDNQGSELAEQVRAHGAAQRRAVQEQWHERWYRRAWLSEECGWMGEKQMWLEPQPWALIGGCVPAEKAHSFVANA